jgi:DNA-binding LacI/PurR family transcriptional regulator
MEVESLKRLVDLINNPNQLNQIRLIPVQLVERDSSKIINAV